MPSNDHPWRNCPIHSKLSTEASNWLKPNTRSSNWEKWLGMGKHFCDILGQFWTLSVSMCWENMRHRTSVEPQTLRVINQRQDCSTTCIFVQSWTSKVNVDAVVRRTWRSKNSFLLVSLEFPLNATSEYKIIGVFAAWRLDWMRTTNRVAFSYLILNMVFNFCERFRRRLKTKTIFFFSPAKLASFHWMRKLLY